MKPSSFEEDDLTPMEGLTPLLDVLFVVLILFILITPMISKEDVALTPQGPKARPLTQNMLTTHPIKITVNAKGDILLNNHPISKEEFHSTCQALHKTHPKVIPQLYHDKQAPFGCFQMIKHHLEKSGFDQIDLIVHKSDLL